MRGETRHEYIHNYGCPAIIIQVTKKTPQTVMFLPCIRVPVPAEAPTILLILLVVFLSACMKIQR
jgi:hypothetical protein